MGKYDYLKPKDHHIFNITRKNIGRNLSTLKMIRACPHNFSPQTIEKVKSNLSMSLRDYHKMLRENPALKGSKQLNLFKNLSNK